RSRGVADDARSLNRPSARCPTYRYATCAGCLSHGFRDEQHSTTKWQCSESSIAQSTTQCQCLGCSLYSPPIFALRTHRAILQSIEEELEPNVATTKLVSPPTTTLCTEPAPSTPCTKNAYSQRPRHPRCREEEQAAGRLAGRQKICSARTSYG
ncbi:unnamed protein product, partial [Ectocarpus sp. 12 AP-2014]